MGGDRGLELGEGPKRRPASCARCRARVRVGTAGCRGFRVRGRAYRSPGLGECGTGRGHPLRHPPSPAFGSSSRSRRRNGTGWGRNGWTVQGQLNRSPPFQRRAGRHGQARCWFDTCHEPPGWRQALPCADRIQLVERGADPATGKLPRFGFGHRGRDPEACRFRPWIRVRSRAKIELGQCTPLSRTGLFVQHGPPDHIRSDNGSEFTAHAVRDWLGRIGVKTLYIEPGSPWENGWNESFNSKLRDEILNTEIIYTLKEAKVLIERWRHHYNTIRPHSSLGYRPPAPETILRNVEGPTYAVEGLWSAHQLNPRQTLT